MCLLYTEAVKSAIAVRVQATSCPRQDKGEEGVSVPPGQHCARSTCSCVAAACRIQPGDFLGMFASGAWLGAAPVVAVEAVDRPDLPANVASKSLPLLDLSPSATSTAYYNATLGVRGPPRTPCAGQA